MDTPAPAAPAASPALDYAPRQGGATARRRWGRRLLRWWPAWVLGVLGGLGIAYGPGAWRHYKLMRLQEACMAAELPADRPVWTDDPAEAAALVAARGAEYSFYAAGHVVRADPRWAALEAELGDGPGPVGVTGPHATVFCRERFTPAGRRRLVVVEDFRLATVIEPGSWFGGAAPRVVVCRTSASDGAIGMVLEATRGLDGPSRVWAGTADPADRTVLRVPFVARGVSGTFEYQLADGDRVAMRLLNPDGFRARAAAAKGGTATRATPALGRSPAGR